MNKLFLTLLPVLALVSCQSGNSNRQVYYPDAVVSLNQVDPAYRAYFRDQHGANYGVQEQREAFAAAVRTARTPVGAYTGPSRPVAKQMATRSTTSAKSRIAATRSKGKAVAAKGKTVAKGRAVATAKGKKAVTKKAVASRKPAAKGRKKG